MSHIKLSSKGLITLKGQKIPEVVDGWFMCDFNYLTSLEFGPKEVKVNFWCNNNHLTSLEFCANKIGKSLYVFDNSIENLKDIHKQFKNGYIGERFRLEDNPVKSHLLGVILIPRLKRIALDNVDVQKL